MNNCSFASQDLLDIVRNFVENGSMPAQMIEHRRDCRACNLIFSSRRHAKAFLDFSREKWPEKAAICDCGCENGQIWRLLTSDEDFLLALLFENENHDFENDMIKAIILRPDPLQQQTSNDDLIVDGGVVFGGMPLLVEVWNRRHILRSSLGEKLTEIDDNLCNKISRHSCEILVQEPFIAAFRRHEIDSAPGEPVDNPMVVKMEFFSQNSQVLSDKFWNPQFVTRMAAASECADSIHGLYETLCRFVEKHSPDFRVRFDHKNCLKIAGMPSQTINLALTFGDSIEKSFTGSNGILEIRNEELVDYDPMLLRKIILTVLKS